MSQIPTFFFRARRTLPLLAITVPLLLLCLVFDGGKPEMDPADTRVVILPTVVQYAPTNEDAVVECAVHVMDEPTLNAAFINHPECQLIYLDMRPELEAAHHQPLL